MLNWPKFFIKQHYKWKPVFPAIIWVLCLKKQINTLTVDRQEICFVSFFIPASLFSTEMDSRSDRLCSFQFNCSLTCATHQIPYQSGKKKKKTEWNLAMIQHREIYMLGKDSCYLKIKAFLKLHWKMSKIFLILVSWYILLICHHLLMAVII